MSELSTVAIKDGHRGHLPHQHTQAPSGLSNQLDAERAALPAVLGERRRRYVVEGGGAALSLPSLAS